MRKGQQGRAQLPIGFHACGWTPKDAAAFSVWDRLSKLGVVSDAVLSVDTLSTRVVAVAACLRSASSFCSCMTCAAWLVVLARIDMLYNLSTG